MKLKVDKSRIKARWEEDYELIPNEGLFEEYLEMGGVFCLHLSYFMPSLQFVLAGISLSNTSVRPSVCPCVMYCPEKEGIMYREHTSHCTFQFWFPFCEGLKIIEKCTHTCGLKFANNLILCIETVLEYQETLRLKCASLIGLSS